MTVKSEILLTTSPTATTPITSGSCSRGLMLRCRKATSTATTRFTSADAAIAIRNAASGGWDADADVIGDGCVTSLDALMILQAADDAIDL